jgi:hypothetical protein
MRFSPVSTLESSCHNHLGYVAIVAMLTPARPGSSKETQHGKLHCFSAWKRAEERKTYFPVGSKPRLFSGWQGRRQIMGNKRTLLLFLSLLFYAFHFSPTVEAATIYVGPGGNCGGKTPCTDAVQTGIDMTEEDLNLSICRGTYIEDIAFPSSSTHRKRVFDCAETVVVDGSLNVRDGEVVLRSGSFVVQNQRLVPVAVPRVTDLEKEAAESAVVDAGLVVGSEDNRGSDTVEENHVIDQSPAAGVMMAPEMPVDLVVSL